MLARRQTVGALATNRPNYHPNPSRTHTTGTHPLVPPSSSSKIFPRSAKIRFSLTRHTCAFKIKSLHQQYPVLSPAQRSTPGFNNSSWESANFIVSESIKRRQLHFNKSTSQDLSLSPRSSRRHLHHSQALKSQPAKNIPGHWRSGAFLSNVKNLACLSICPSNR